MKTRKLPLLIVIVTLLIASAFIPQERAAPIPLDPQRILLRSVYTAEIGVREKTGKNDGPRVAEYLRYTRLGEGYAWCASFVSWVFGEAGFDRPRTPWTPALFPSKRVIWKRGRSISNHPPPQAGDVFGIWFNDLGRIAHAGMIDQWDDKYVITVEGNTNGTGSNNGNGVYRKRRLTKSLYVVADWVSGVSAR